jgi:serine protease Do
MKNQFWKAAGAIVFTTFILISADQRGAHAFSFFKSDSTPTQQSETALLSKTAHVFNALAKKATPAVVSITTVKLLSPEAAEAAEIGQLFEPHNQTSDRLPGTKLQIPDQHVVGLGSGIVLKANGIILTNSHVVDHAQKIEVTLADNDDDKNKYSAHLLGIDPKTDLAVIQMDKPPAGLSVLKFGDSDALKVGDWAIAVGSPYGLKHTVTFGIISATGRAQMGILDTEDFIQTDAAINPGSSGGPLLDANGNVIGVNTAIYSQGGGFSGIGFAVPSKIAKEVSAQLIDHGRMIRGWIGLAAQDLDSDLAKHFHAPSQKGALVSEVLHGGPASQASLQAGDVVLSYNHQPVDSAERFKSLVGKTTVDSVIPMDISRNGISKTLSIHVLEAPGAPELASQQLAGVAATHTASLGLGVEEIPNELSDFLHLPERTGAVVVSVVPGGAGFDAGLSPGDIILTVDDKTVHGAKDFKQIASHLKAPDTAILYVQHGPSEKTFVPIKFEG